MPSYTKPVLYVLLFILSAIQSIASDYQSVKNLKADLQVYSPDSEGFQPPGDTKTNSVHYRFSKKRHYELIQINGKQEFYIYLNNLLIAKKTSEKPLIINLNKINQLKQENTLTLWSQKSVSLEELDISEVVKVPEAKQGFQLIEINKALKSRKSILIILITLLLLAVSFLKKQLFSKNIFNTLLNFRFSSDTIRYEPTNMVFVVVLLVYSLIATIFIYRFFGDFKNIIFFNELPVWGLYAATAALLTVVYLLKYQLIYLIMEWFTELAGIAKKYYVTYISFNFVFSIIMILELILSLILKGESYEGSLFELAKWSVLLFIAFRTGWILLSLRNYYHFQLIQVLSYICTLEIFPWLVLITFYTKLGA